jgi:hypothetical protein
MGKGPRIFGVYQIKSISTGRIYIGCSNDIYRRWEAHKSLLKHGKHSNQFLQNHYNVYGLKDFEFSILEKYNNLPYDKLLMEEQSYISKFGSFGNGNFNLTRGGSFVSDARKQKCRIQNIFTLEVKEFESLVDAADFIGIDKSSMSKVLKGKKKQMKGWCSAELGYDESELNRKNRVLYHRDHGEVKVGDNMLEFARKYKLNEKVIHKLFTKPERYKSHKGWTIFDTNIQKKINKRYKKIACYDEHHVLIEEFDIASDAARKFNCSPSSIAQALKSPFIRKCLGLYWDYLQ